MPVPEIEALSSNSGDAQVKAAISACIAQEVRAGREQQQAIAMCYSMAKERTGGGQAAPAAPEGQ
jgi:hypothetical protein